MTARSWDTMDRADLSGAGAACQAAELGRLRELVQELQRAVDDARDALREGDSAYALTLLEQVLGVATQLKTRAEIEALKENWLSDPCWDIEDTEGFRAHYGELYAFRLAHENGCMKAQLKGQRSALQALKRLLEGV